MERWGQGIRGGAPLRAGVPGEAVTSFRWPALGGAGRKGRELVYRLVAQFDNAPLIC
jgi:hypothetical protein